ncbi:MAG TPA: dihydropyrimidinase [Devosia sp.]|nr:dihydropyrimidinase [Devosia sp.]
MTYDLVIANGTLVSPEGVMDADIGVINDIIAAIGNDLGDAHETIDASGKLVLPGGIDSHVHLDQPTAPGLVMGDDFASGTRSAVWGGNTTVLPFCQQRPGEGLRTALKEYHGRAEGSCYCDVSFHLIITDPTPQVLGQELPALLRDGYNSLKVYMTYEDLALSDYQILEVMNVARDTGALVMVHAENFDAIRFRDKQFEQQGKTAMVYHAKSRPIIVEREATHRAISLAELMDVPVMIVHVSNGQAIEEIRRARARGAKVYGETCPQYLVLTEQDLETDPAQGYICSPPPRDVASQNDCWDGIRDGVFDVFSSDHCPYRMDETGKLNPESSKGYRWVPNGIPGIETRLPILFSEGVSKGRIDIMRFVDLTATAPAKLYGLYPRKGTIAVGADADIAIWDPHQTRRIRQADLHHGCDYTPYEGLEITGWPVTTVVRGRIMVHEGELVGEPGWGIHLPRMAGAAH